MRPSKWAGIAWLALWLITGSAVRAQETFFCTSLWPSEELTEIVGDMPCEEYRVSDEHFLALDGQHRVFFQPGWLDSEPRHEIVRRTIRAVADSLTYYNDLAASNGFEIVTDTNVLLGVEDYVEDWGELGAVQPITQLAYTGACPVLIDARRALRSSPGGFHQVIAHELFHCLEHSNQHFLDDANIWWFEGAAEYFSNVVYSIPNLEYDMSPLFDPLNTPADHLSSDLEYSTIVFFQYLGNTAGPAWVLRQLFGLPRDGDHDQLLDALAHWPDMANYFQGFAQAFVDNKIYDSSDRLLPGTTTAHVLPLNPEAEPAEPLLVAADEGPETLIFDITPFTFDLQPILLVNGKEFEIDVMANDRTGTYAVKQPDGDSTWGTFPTQIHTDCTGPPRTYWLLATSTATVSAAETNPYRLTMRVTAGEREDCATALLDNVPYDCVAQTGGQILDNCLFGTWRMTDESLVESHFGGPSRAEDSNLTHEGSIQLAFDGSGTFLKRYDASFNLVKFAGPNLERVQTNTTTTYSGFVGGCLTSERMPIGPNYLTLHGEQIDEVEKHTVGIRDMVFEVDRTDKGTPWNEWPRLQGGGRITYSCADDALTIGKRQFQRTR